ncbi:MAG TPA: protealysin inhibitor emfourin [Thermopolyspora sp.]
MRVSIVRGGGIAGLVMNTTADSASLAPEDADLLRAKVEQAGLFEAGGDDRERPSEPGRERPPERFDYELRVEDQGRTHTLRLGERDLTGPQRALISYVGSVPGHREEVTPLG